MKNNKYIDILPVPLSYSQEGLWIVDKAMGSLNYHIPLLYKLNQAIDLEVLKLTFQTILKRHQVLRTVFKQNEIGDVSQEILTIENWKIDYEAEYEIRNTSELQTYVEKLNAIPFDLEKDYMLRVHFLKKRDNEYFLILIFHHIAFDGWSSSLFLEELQKIYNLKISENQNNLLEVTYQYTDYAMSQRSEEKETVFEDKLTFWKSFLEGHTPLNFPTDFPRPNVQSYKGKTYIFELPKEYKESLKNISKEYRATPFMILFGVYNILLYKYTGQTDIIVGSPTANRMNPQDQRLIGCFVNPLALRTTFSNTITVKDLLETVKMNFMNVYEHQDLPFEKIVKALVTEHDRSRSPLFQVMFIMQSNKSVASVKLGDVDLYEIAYEGNTSKYDMTFSITDKEETLEVLIEYCDDLFLSKTIEQIANHYKKLVGEVLEKPNSRIDELEMLLDEEQDELLVTLNDGDVNYPFENFVLDQFKKVSNDNAIKTALVCEDKEMTYHELDKKSNQLAVVLIENGIDTGDKIGLCTDRSFDVIIGILAIWKANACYVPIDPLYPLERINYIVKDANIKNIVYSSTITVHQKLEKPNSIYITEALFQKESSIQLKKRTITSDQLAYIIYTSGSTGKPKGVMITHGNLNAFVGWCKEEFKNDSFEIVYAVTSVCFDLSIFEMTYPLCVGKKIRILPNGLSISTYIKTDKNILLNTVPSVIANLQDNNIDFGNVNQINMAGETIPQKVIDRIDFNKIIARNLYGPSEDTTYSTCYRLHHGSKSLIGKPISNTQVYVLDDTLTLLPKGIIGELYLGGDGVALGYLNREKLTKEKFVLNPFETGTSNKIYKTGDLVRWLPDGNLEFIGRKDTQIKMRGFRIELGEIETILSQVDGVKQCVVIVSQNDFEDKQLIAYVVPEKEEWEIEATHHLRLKLPKYMIPNIWLELEIMPLNTNGKVDKNKLPVPQKDIKLEERYIAPSTSVEKELVHIWKKVLGIQKIGVHEQLIELGGHSLVAAKLVILINNTFLSTITVGTLLELQTISMIGKYLQNTMDPSDHYPEGLYEVLDI
ncbi:amino acid adenylation domain-containing protein [Aquimarina sp. ERC-38]|uniref:non-ribosomal peptide synthetase n=1 Tax=Aquimarina sp. ERC-38 TaxID=2949996 RepID=UPI0022450580|nr:amino acid adenylation domain-containing protein [Aquimarina sp. ERC-38]UZO79162.1 amino acid adenylation domain-containing protein [Aquimarina sp. ERC-38]